MRKLNVLIAVLISLTAISFLTSCSAEEPQPVDMMNAGSMGDGGDSGNDSENKAPNFSLTSVNGGQVSLGDFEEQPLVIFFFGSTCPLCISSAPSIEAGIKQEFAGEDMSIIGIDTWDGNQAAVENFRNTTGVTFDLLLNGSAVESDYDITYDRLLVVDGEGNIVFKGGSSASNDVDDVVEVVKGLLE